MWGDQFLGFDLRGTEITGKVAGVVRASWSGAGGGEEEGVVVEMRTWCSLKMLDLSGSSGLGSEPHTLECLHKLLQHSRGKVRLQAQVSRRIHRTTVLSTGSPSWTVA